MLILFALPVIAAVAATYRYLQCCAPSNLLARQVRASAPTLPKAGALLALAAVLLTVMHVLAEAVAGGASGWLNLVVIALAWDAIKLGALAGYTALRRLRMAAGSAMVVSISALPWTPQRVAD